MRIYADTSVISGLFDMEPRIKKASYDFFHKAGISKWVIYISDLVARELERTRNAPKRIKLINAVEEHNLQMLAVTEEARVLAEIYLKERVIPVKYIADAIHIAVASIYNIPILVSWNFQHMVKYKTRKEVNFINRKNNYPQIDICSPEEI